MSVVHDFRASLAKSHEYADAPWWKEVYGQAFPDHRACIDMREYGWWQGAGIDRTVVLKNGQSVHIDEKVRTVDWPDVLLEVWSDVDKKKLGWVAKDLAAHYIAYAYIPSRTCLLLPFLQLRAAWKINRHAWKAAYGYKDALNQGYTTRSVPVPRDVLRQAIMDTMQITWSANNAVAA